MPRQKQKEKRDSKRWFVLEPRCDDQPNVVVLNAWGFVGQRHYLEQRKNLGLRICFSSWHIKRVKGNASQMSMPIISNKSSNGWHYGMAMDNKTEKYQINFPLYFS